WACRPRSCARELPTWCAFPTRACPAPPMAPSSCTPRRRRRSAARLPSSALAISSSSTCRTGGSISMCRMRRSPRAWPRGHRRCRRLKAAMPACSTIMSRGPIPVLTSTSSRADAAGTFPVTATNIAIVGVGKIARDQHVPAIFGNDRFRLAATVSSHSGLDGIDNFETLDALLAARPDIEAMALCMPPQVRYEAAAKAIAADRHVLLEKPPGATIAEVEALVRMAKAQNVALFATWHSRFAAAVEPARLWLQDKKVRHVSVIWKEDVRRWHPGQAWIWQPGGLGVFDPGINALSIVTRILPEPFHLVSSTLEFPDGRDAPIAAMLRFAGDGGFQVEAGFDWRQTGPQSWDIEVETE